MGSTDIVLSCLAAAAVASLTWLGLTQARKDKDDEQTRPPVDSALADMVALTAIVTFVATMVARHPEWVSWVPMSQERISGNSAA